MATAIGRDRFAVDEFHYKVRQALRRRAAVEQTRDVRMIERSQNLPFTQEPVAHEVGVHPAFDDLDRHLAPELLIVTLGLVNVSHSAASDQSSDVIRPDATSRQIVFGSGGERQRGVGDRITNEIFGRVPIDEGEHFAPQILIGAASPRQIGSALVRRAINRRAKNLFYALPALRTHERQAPFLGAATRAPAASRARSWLWRGRGRRPFLPNSTRRNIATR